ncbi:phosphomethylpyrimidine kinase [Phlyctema vagabunda]|uniref:Phosphomethylpyrimidine kinase n=1 Tax=Phlyctema vagabunda TaxID=108571 RepID=A0ABR4PNT0_9HELO
MTPPNVLLLGLSHRSLTTAGLETEQQILTAHGCNSWMAITELTVDSSESEIDSIPTPPSFLKRQIETCLQNNSIDIIKVGGVASVEIYRVLLETVEAYEHIELFVELRGLLEAEARIFLAEKLLPRITLLYTSFHTFHAVFGKPNDQFSLSSDSNTLAWTEPVNFLLARDNNAYSLKEIGGASWTHNVTRLTYQVMLDEGVGTELVLSMHSQLGTMKVQY